MKRQNVKLVAFDLDGTLIRGDTVLEVLAANLGKLDRMRELERTTSWADLDAIARARQEVSGWFQGVPTETLLSYLPAAKEAPRAAEGIAMLREAGIKTAIVSITWEFAVKWFCTRLGIDYGVGAKLTDKGEIIHLWPDDKPIWLANLSRSLGFTLEQVAAVGDSGGDLAMLKAVGFPYFVGAELPSEISHAVHMPDADILLLAEHILSRGQSN